MENNNYDPNKGFGNNNPGYSNQQGQYQSGQQNQQHNYQQQQQQQNYQHNYQQPILQKLPNSGGILTLGILSIISLCCCGPTLGPILAVIALALSPGASRALKSNPEIYSKGSIGNFKAGKICAIIGLILGAIFLFMYIIGVILDSSLNQEIMDAFNEAWNEMNY
jgi:hypothetical protein